MHRQRHSVYSCLENYRELAIPETENASVRGRGWGSTVLTIEIYSLGHKKTVCAVAKALKFMSYGTESTKMF